MHNQIDQIYSSPAPTDSQLVVDTINDGNEEANNILNGGTLEKYNEVKSIQAGDNLHKSLTYANDTSKQICSTPYPGLKLPQKGGIRRKTRRRRRKTRRIRRKPRCMPRKPKRRKSNKKK